MQFQFWKTNTNGINLTAIISGETQEECMEDGDAESLAQSLPRDLAEFVLLSNNEFRDECTLWDKGLEERKRLEESQKELAQQQGLAGNSGLASISTDLNNDVLVSSTINLSILSDTINPT